jgi:hypothetical protein
MLQMLTNQQRSCLKAKKELRNNRKGLKQQIATVRNAPENQKASKEQCHSMPPNERMASRYTNQNITEKTGE